MKNRSTILDFQQVNTENKQDYDQKPKIQSLTESKQINQEKKERKSCKKPRSLGFHQGSTESAIKQRENQWRE